MTCVSVAALSLFLQITEINFTNTPYGLVLHASNGDVTYWYNEEPEGYCYER